MPQSLSLTLAHLVFSTKDRMPFLTPDIRADLHAYLATVARHGDGECYRVGGVADHVHLAVRLSRTVSIADLISELKTSSSKWLKDRSPALSKFAWQRGYASFLKGVAH
jgi:REP element-mobilizing transposase RayT